MLEKNKIYQGDCLELLKKLPDNSVDTIITDPPYGLSFMGKKWDYDVPVVDVWKECLRVSKHGGTALIFAGSRTQHRMAINVEDAGFILKDTIMWVYSTGFPKATNISKQLMKKFGDKGIKTGDIIKNEKNFRSLGKNTKEFHGLNKLGVGVSCDRIDIDIINPSHPEAKLWNGWYSHGLKPSYEPVIVAVKPNDGSYSDNALKHGVSGLWIDGCRISYNEDLSVERSGNNLDTNNQGWGFKAVSRDNKGRFPANIIFDEGACKLLDEQTFGKVGGGHWSKTKVSGFGEFGNGKSEYLGVGEKDKDKITGASRFFYCPKTSSFERNIGCENLISKYSDDSRVDKDAVGCNNPRNRSGVSKKNFHHTVKPIKLMEYFANLTRTPFGGLVLDPFTGSGSTLIACHNVGRDWIGFELDEDYVNIANSRLSFWLKNSSERFSYEFSQNVKDSVVVNQFTLGDF